MYNRDVSSPEKETLSGNVIFRTQPVKINEAERVAITGEYPPSPVKQKNFIPLEINNKAKSKLNKVRSERRLQDY